MPTLKSLTLALLSISPMMLNAIAPETIQISVRNEVLHSVDARLFGQFMERPSWGETGPEAAANKQGKLPPKIIGLMAEMDIPIVRFPGGTDIDYTDWTDMVSNVPGRSAERPVTTGHTNEQVTNHFGFDEYFALARDLNWESIIVVNLLDGAAAKKPMDEAALHAAGLVAYCNLTVGAKLPHGMPNWPTVRAKNGYPEPYGARYVQLGNETWIGKWKKTFKEQFAEGDVAAQTQRYLETVTAYIKAIKAVDPDIQIIMDLNFPADNKTVLSDPYIKANINFVAHHIYGPMGVNNKKYGNWMSGKEPIGMTSDEWEFAFNTTLGNFDEAGQNVAFGKRLDVARELGYAVAITEWNWNGWGFGSIDTPLEFERRHSQAVGTAGYLNGMIRQGDVIKIGTQSLLVGHSWDIGSIQYNRDDLEPTYYNAQGAVTTLYNLNHGGEALAVDISNAPLREQPYMMGVTSAPGKVATFDAVATKSPHALYLHLVNRDPSSDADLSIDLSAFKLPLNEATLIRLAGVSANEMAANGGWMKTVESSIPLDNDHASVSLAPSSVAILKLPIVE